MFITVGPAVPPGNRPSIDLSAHKSLVVNMRAEAKGECVRLGIKDRNQPDDGGESTFSECLTTQWSTLTLSLGAFIGADPSQLYVVFEVVFGGSSSATVELSNIRYSPNQAWLNQGVHTSQDLYGIAWSGSQFVAVGASGTILTSNGKNWTSQYSGTDQPLSGVAWSGSQFVAVGASGTILTSPDGKNWTAQNSGTDQDLFGVAWSGSQFVAVGTGGIILTSPDGSIWMSQPPGTNQNLSGVTWSGSQFVIVADSGTILTSQLTVV